MKKESYFQSMTEPMHINDYRRGFSHFIEVNNPPISDMLKAEIEAKKQQCIRHYTNIDSLLKILRNKSILCNRIDKVNDVDESKALHNNHLSERVFVSCFNKSERESIPLWFIYNRKG